MEFIVGIAFWGGIFIIWYLKNYSDRLNFVHRIKKPSFHWPKRQKKEPQSQVSSKDYKSLVATVETICAKDRFGSSDAASMVLSVKKIMEIEPASGQIWEAYALDSLETADIYCDDCKIPVEKVVKKTGVKISCNGCKKWIALKNFESHDI